METINSVNIKDFDLMWRIVSQNNLYLGTNSMRWHDYIMHMIKEKKDKHISIDWVGPWHRGSQWIHEDTDYYRNELRHALSTYDGCVSTTIKAIEKDQKRYFDVHITVWDGDFVTGERTTVRCHVTFQLKTVPPELQNMIRGAIRAKAEDTLIKQERLEREKLIETLMNNMINIY